MSELILDEFFQNFSYQTTYVYAKGNTHTQRETGLLTRRKSQIFIKIGKMREQIILQHAAYSVLKAIDGLKLG